MWTTSKSVFFLSSLTLVLVSFFVEHGSAWSSGVRSARYVEFDPPRIVPDKEFQTVKAGGNYSFRCEGGKARGVSWRLPVEATDDLR